MSDTQSTITAEQLETLASAIELTEHETRGKLTRLMTAYTRILAVREPLKFERRATEWSDEDGHYDNSYPPTIKHKDFTGPRAIRLAGAIKEEIATSGGFYYDWRIATTDPGLYITRAGHLIGCEHSGTGSFGQFAAHPGNCNVMVTMEWRNLDEEDIPTERLVEAEKKLRDMAFPYVAAARGAA